MKTNWQARESPAAIAQRKAREGRAFALTLAGAFLVIALLALRKQRQTLAAVALTISAAFLLSGLLIPDRLGPLRGAWMKLGEVMGYVTTPIVMGAMYYLVFTPVAISRRILRRDARKSPGWIQRPPLPSRDRLERQF